MRTKLFQMFFGIIGLLALVVVVAVAEATHSWGGYHFARTTNPLTLKLGDDVSSVWDSYLVTASAGWNASTTLLATTIVPGQTNPKNCRAVNGRVEVCNSKYGSNGWLGIAQIWLNGSHITQGTVKLNDTYFNTAAYNTPAWRNLVVCQEIGHTFGLDHQDTIFTNDNLGTCMDYTNDPSTNQYPNAHDFEELGIIYTHLDSGTTLTSGIGNNKPAFVEHDEDFNDPSVWGKAVRQDAQGRDSLFMHDFGNGEKVFTFVTWVQS